MNGLVDFRLCKLTDKELAEKVDNAVDSMYETGKVPTRHIPARPDSDFDLLIGELIMRFMAHVPESIRSQNDIETAKLEGILKQSDHSESDYSGTSSMTCLTLKERVGLSTWNRMKKDDLEPHNSNPTPHNP